MPPEFLIQNLLPANALVLLVGPPKSGKTDLAAAMARAIATGRPFADRATEPGTVFWISYEEPNFPDPPKNAPLYFTASLPPIDKEQTKQEVMQAVLAARPSLVVIDSLYGASRRNLRQRSNALRQLVDLKAAFPCTVLVLHHTLKRDPRPCEARQVLLAADAVIRPSLSESSSFQAVPSHAKPSQSHAGQSSVNAKRMTLYLSGDALPSRSVDLQTPAPGHYRAQSPFARVGKPSTAIHKVLNALRFAPMTSTQLQQATHLNPYTLRNTLQRLRLTSQIHQTKGRKWTLKRIHAGSNVPT